MKKCLLSFVALVAAAILLIPGTTRASDASDATNAGQQKPATFEKVKLKCLVYLPKEYDRKEAWPVLLCLHGIGERGDNLDLVKKHGPPKLIAGGKHFPFIVVSPQCPNGQWWSSSELSALLDEIAKKYKVDQDRIYLTGLSMGGFGTWAWAAYQPNRFAAIVPICGGGDPGKAKQIAHIPAWVFHGGKDRTVPIENSKKMVDALKKAGAEPKFTIYPEAGHDSWTQAYNTPELYEWLLQQKRTTKKADESKK